MDFIFQPARERHSVQIRDRADAERGERVAEFILALKLRGPAFAFEALGNLLW